MNEDYISLKEAAVILGKGVEATRATIKRNGIQTIDVKGKHGIELRVHVHGLKTFAENARTAPKSKGGTSDASKVSKPPRKAAQKQKDDVTTDQLREELERLAAIIEAKDDQLQAERNKADQELSDLKTKLERKEAIIEAKDAQLDEAHRDYNARLEAKDQRFDEVIGNMTAALSARSAADSQPKAIEAAKPRTWLGRLLRRD